MPHLKVFLDTDPYSKEEIKAQGSLDKKISDTVRKHNPAEEIGEVLVNPNGEMNVNFLGIAKDNSELQTTINEDLKKASSKESLNFFYNKETEDGGSARLSQKVTNKDGVKYLKALTHELRYSKSTYNGQEIFYLDFV